MLALRLATFPHKNAQVSCKEHVEKRVFDVVQVEAKVFANHNVERPGQLLVECLLQRMPY